MIPIVDQFHRYKDQAIENSRIIALVQLQPIQRPSRIVTTFLLGFCVSPLSRRKMEEQKIKKRLRKRVSSSKTSAHSKIDSPAYSAPTPAWDYTNPDVISNLQHLDTSLKSLIKPPSLDSMQNLLSADELLAYFETREKQKHPDVLANRLENARKQEEKEFDAFQEKLKRKKIQWENKKLKFIHDQHVAKTKSVCLLKTSPLSPVLQFLYIRSFLFCFIFNYLAFNEVFADLQIVE